MRYRYYTCDVFSETRFGGNQLAVLPEASGLTTEQMQNIAREFNYSESTFVLPAERGHTRRVRIFTPTREIPFAGHPNVGTAFVLASTGQLGPVSSSFEVTFEEDAGLVPIAVRSRDLATIWCELAAPNELSLGPVVPAELIAEALSLDAADIREDTHPPQVASVGLPFVFVELAEASKLGAIKLREDRFEAISELGIFPDIHVYVRTQGEFDIRARMFAPMDGIPEDPATGSANCALAGLLAHCDPMTDGEFTWRIAQGVEMGRPSVLDARSEKREGRVTGTWIGGTSVMVSEGFIRVG